VLASHFQGKALAWKREGRSGSHRKNGGKRGKQIPFTLHYLCYRGDHKRGSTERGYQLCDRGDGVRQNQKVASSHMT